MAYYQRSGGLFSNLPAVTKNLLVINVFMMIFTWLKGDFMYETFSLFYPKSPFFHIWQPITYMFMHGNGWHLFFNMFSLLMFGCTLERQWGPRKFLRFYMIAGIGAAAVHLGVMWFQDIHYLSAGNDASLALQKLYFTPTVGASGAIYGILMGFAMLFPDEVMVLLFPPIPLKAKWWILIFIAIELATGLSSSGSGIAHFAHLGGMLFGYLLVRYWKRKGTMYDYEGYDSEN